MTVILKIMSDEPLLDSDPDKKFELIELSPSEIYRFRHEYVPDSTVRTVCQNQVVVLDKDKMGLPSKTIPVKTNVYVLDEENAIIDRSVIVSKLALTK